MMIPHSYFPMTLGKYFLPSNFALYSVRRISLNIPISNNSLEKKIVQKKELATKYHDKNELQ